MKISESITYVTERETELIENSALEKDAADRIKQKALQLAGLKKKAPRLRIVWVCAAVTALLACGVFAAETTGLDYRLAGLFENGQSVDMGEAVQNLDESVEANGVKIPRCRQWVTDTAPMCFTELILKMRICWA